MNRVQIILTGRNRLQRIVIGDQSFRKVRRIGIIGMNNLESLVIGQSSFRIGNSEQMDGSFRVENCPKLNSIKIKYDSFYDYHSFSIMNLPSLHSIDIGGWCFHYVSMFALSGLNRMRGLTA